MRNKAYIASNINSAIIFSDKNSVLIGGSFPEQDIDNYLLSHLLAINPEIKEVYYNSVEELKHEILSEFEKQNALSMALELMDNSFSNDYREGIAKLLVKEIEAKPELLIFLKNRFLSTLLPESFNPDLPIQFILNHSKELFDLYNDLTIKAKLFACFYTIFKLELNLELSDQELVDTALTDKGCYASFTIALYEKSLAKYNATAVNTIYNLEKLHFFQDMQLFTELQERLEKGYQIILKDSDFKEEFSASTNESDSIAELINKYFNERKIKEEKKFWKWVKLKRINNIQEIIETIAQIKKLVVEHGPNSQLFFNEFELVVHKVLNSDTPEDLYKICYDLASYFITFYQFDLSNRLLFYAQLLNPNDRAIYTQKALTLHKTGKLNEALELYQSCIDIGNDIADYCGKAEVLRDMGKYEDALIQYDFTIQKFPNEPAPFNAKAEILRDMGKHEEALDQYDKSILKFPNEPVAYNRKADVLRDIGNLKKGRVKGYVNIPASIYCKLCKECGSRPVIARIDDIGYIVKCSKNDNHYQTEPGLIDIEDWNRHNTAIYSFEDYAPEEILSRIAILVA